jgi:hypothetical protein
MPSDTPAVHKPRIVKPASGESGPVYDYRGAVIYSNEKGTNYTFALEGFPHGPRGLSGSLGHLNVIVELVDAWLDAGKLPAPYVNKAG